MTQDTHEPRGYETLTAADAWFLMTGRAPTPEEEDILDAWLHAEYVKEFGEEPPKKYVFPDQPGIEPSP